MQIGRKTREIVSPIVDLFHVEWRHDKLGVSQTNMRGTLNNGGGVHSACGGVSGGNLDRKIAGGARDDAYDTTENLRRQSKLPEAIAREGFQQQNKAH